MLSSAELGEALSVVEVEEAAALWAGAGAGGGGGAALVRALLGVGGPRAAALLAQAPEAAARALLDALGEGLRAAAAGTRAHALATAAPLLALRPAWLARLPPAALAALCAALGRCARHERQPLPLLHALLALAALLPAAPHAAHALWPDLPAVLVRALAPSAPSGTGAGAVDAHLQLARLALFHALYATHPCTLLEALRAELASPAARAAFERGLAPLLRSARLHPALLTGTRHREADAGRWARAEPHDVLAEAHALAGPAPAHQPHRPPAASPPPPLPSAEPSPPPAEAPEPLPGTAAWAARAAATLRPGGEGWFALGEAAAAGRGGTPATPVPQPEPEPEPEAAVEATPENTPAKETRAAFRFPGESGAVRAIGRRSPRAEPSPPADAGTGSTSTSTSGRLARVLSERRALESPVAFAAGAPAGVARPEPRPPRQPEPEPEPEEAPWEALPDAHPRELLAALSPLVLRPTRAARPRGPPARRAASLSPHRGRQRASASVQTDTRWPEPYEFLIADFYNSLPEEPSRPAGEPSERLEAYLEELVAGGAGAGAAGADEVAQQLALTQAALMFERWRREAHAERNRRLLGRVRAARAADLALRQERARNAELAAERDELRARLAAAASCSARAPACPAPAEREQRLEAALAEERALRVRAEARLAESQAARALSDEHAQRAADSADDDLHLRALARAAAAAGPRARHVRRLQRELLALGEREQRLREAAEAVGASALAARAGAQQAQAPRGGEHEERALRAACARAEAELQAAAARADALAARALELEAALAARDAQLAEVRRALRAAGAEHAARAAAMRDKYAALLRVLRAGDERALRRRAEAELAAPVPPPKDHPPNQPANHDEDS